MRTITVASSNHVLRGIYFPDRCAHVLCCTSTAPWYRYPRFCGGTYLFGAPRVLAPYVKRESTSMHVSLSSLWNSTIFSSTFSCFTARAVAAADATRLHSRIHTGVTRGGPSTQNGATFKCTLQYVWTLFSPSDEK